MNVPILQAANVPIEARSLPVPSTPLPITNREPPDQGTEVTVLTPDGSGFQLMSAVKAKEVEWVVPNLIPKGEVSILGGDGGVGKGLYIAQLVSYVTAGKTSEFFSESPTSTGNVVIFSAEDQLDSVLRPRLEAAGADLNKVWAVEPGSYFEDVGEMPYLDDPRTVKRIIAARPSLVIFDPIQQFLSPKAELTSRMKMREATAPLRAAGRQHGFSVLMVVHTNKSANVSGRKRLSGSADLWDVARSVMIMGRTKNEGKVYVSHEKVSNATPAETVLFTIAEAEVQGVPTAQAVFDSTSEWKDADFINEKPTRSTGKADNVQEIIMTVLSETPTGQMVSSELQKLVMGRAQCCESTYNHARSTLSRAGVIANIRQGAKGGRGCCLTALSQAKR